MSIAEKLQTIAENEQKVFEAGKKSEYDSFWDNYQDFGKRANYEFAFAGKGWTDKNFKPKYDIVLNGPYTGTQMFTGSLITDLRKILEERNITLDISGNKNIGQFIQNSMIISVPTLDLSNASGVTGYAFATPNLKSIEKLISSEFTNWQDSTFNGATALETVIFDGVVAKNNLNLQWSTKLDKDSLTSIINALSMTTSGLTVTLSKTAVNTAFTDTEWATLIATKPNWTINLV